MTHFHVKTHRRHVGSTSAKTIVGLALSGLLVLASSTGLAFDQLPGPNVNGGSTITTPFGPGLTIVQHGGVTYIVPSYVPNPQHPPITTYRALNYPMVSPELPGIRSQGQTFQAFEGEIFRGYSQSQPGAQSPLDLIDMSRGWPGVDANLDAMRSSCSQGRPIICGSGDPLLPENRYAKPSPGFDPQGRPSVYYGETYTVPVEEYGWRPTSSTRCPLTGQNVAVLGRPQYVRPLIQTGAGPAAIGGVFGVVNEAAPDIESSLNLPSGSVGTTALGGICAYALATGGAAGLAQVGVPIAAGAGGRIVVSQVSDNPTHQAAGEFVGFVGGGAAVGGYIAGPPGAAVGALTAEIGYAGYAVGSISYNSYQGIQAGGWSNYWSAFGQEYVNSWYW